MLCCYYVHIHRKWTFFVYQPSQYWKQIYSPAARAYLSTNVSDGGRKAGGWGFGLFDITIPSLKNQKTLNKWDMIYIICNAGQVQTFGDVYIPILRSISVGELKRSSTIKFPTVVYMPLRVKDLSQIRIELQWGSGRPVELMKDGTTACTLQLRWLNNTDRLLV